LTFRFPTPNLVRFLTLLILLVGLTATPARSEEAAPPPPPVVDTPPPPPFPVTVYAEDDRPSDQPAAEVQRVAAQQAQQPAGDPYGFTAWLNGVRARSGLGAVGYDPNLSGWAGVNNGQQQARGMGHHVMGPARRQNSGMGDFSTVTQMWMASPAHQAALLDPSITWVGIAGLGAYWTFNAY
jgi:Cysteine-rich secretory protein family